LIDAWTDLLQLKLAELTFLSDQEGEFAELSAEMKDHAKMACFHPKKPRLKKTAVKIRMCSWTFAVLLIWN